MITTLLTLLFTVSLASAAPAEDLATASNKDASESARQAAFDRLIAESATDQSLLLKVAADDSADARQRWVATRALGKAGGPRARDALLALLSDDMPAMKVAAAQALGDLGDRSAVAPLIELLSDPAMLVRAAAAAGLGQLGDAAAVDPLSKALAARDNYYRGTSLWVRTHYVDALGQIGSKKALPALLLALDDKDEAVAEAAVAALESVARFSFADGRTEAEERAAWKRWASNEIRSPG